MKIITESLDFIALFIQLGGTYIMYKNSPDNKPNVARTVVFGEANYSTPQKKNGKFKSGFKILGIGFGIQLISMIIKLFF